MATEENLDDSKAPLIEHLVELRTRLIRSVIAIMVMFVVCFFFADEIFNILVVPLEKAAGELREMKLIFTSPQEYFFSQLKIGLFGALFLAFPVIASQIYLFMAPGLYRHERAAFYPFLIATPILFALGACLVYFLIMPLAMGFFLGFEQTGDDGRVAIELLPRVSEYLGLIMTLIFAFGFVFQLPVVLTLMARVNLIGSDTLTTKRKYAVVIAFAMAAILTPPDPISQIGLALPTLVLYEISIYCVKLVERQRERNMLDDEAEDA